MCIRDSDRTIINKDPEITGNNIYSKDTSESKAMRGFATAGGWMHLKYIIKTTETPTDKPNVINETPINSLKIIPVTIQTKCPKNIFLGWAISLLCKAKAINTVGPKEIISQKPVDVS